MREKNIEQKFVHSVKAAGGIAPKLVSPGFDGMPDRMVLMPEGRIAFVEVKAPGEKPRPLHWVCRGESTGRGTKTLTAITAQAPAAAGLQGVCAGQRETDYTHH